MSCFTENTIVVKREAEEKLKHDLEAGRDWCRIRGDKCVFRNNKYAVYIFDCNGDQPWEVMFGEDRDNLLLEWSDIVATETYYGDGRWTRVYKNGRIEDTRFKLVTYMKNRLTPDEYEIIKKKTAYS